MFAVDVTPSRISRGKLMDIGFIGTGRITRRLIRGLAGRGQAISVTRRSERVSTELAAEHSEVEVVDTAQEVVDRSDVVFVCLGATVAREVLPGLEFSAEQAVISVMAGVTLDELRAMAAPATDICVTIPMPFIEHGDCPLPVHPRSEALEAVYGERNPVIPVASEAALAPFWAVAGTMASVLKELQTISVWLGQRIDDPSAGERYVASLYGGYLANLEKDGAGRLNAALTDLSTEGGLNATLRDRITESGHYDDLAAGLDALYERLQAQEPV